MMKMKKENAMMMISDGDYLTVTATIVSLSCYVGSDDDEEEEEHNG